MYKILFLASAGYGRGGASIALKNIVSQLKDKVEIHIAFPSKGNLYSEFEQMGVHCYTIGKFQLTIYPNSYNPIYFIKTFLLTLLNNRKAQRKLEGIVDSVKPDIIHTNVGPLRIGYNVAQKKEIPHVWHIREYIDKDFSMHPYLSFQYHVDKYHSKNNYNIVITNGVKEHFSLFKNTQVVYDGVFPNTHNERIYKKDNYFLFAGRIQSAKGVLELLYAYNEYVKNGGTVCLKLAGSKENDYYNKCCNFIRLHGLSDNVEYLGLRDDIYMLMAHAKALIVPSLFEGFGFITAEAMYNHCLVIGRDTAGTKEQFDLGFKQTGEEIALRFQNQEELIARLFEAEAGVDEDMVARAYNVVMSNYTNDICGERIYNIYKQILEGK